MPKGMSEISLSFIFRLHRLFFGGSSAFPKECLLNFFAFYFGGIRVAYISAVFGSAFPKEQLLSRKLTLRSLRNGFSKLQQTYTALFKNDFL
jgi:hypothetical protein